MQLVAELGDMLRPSGCVAPPRWINAAIRDDAGRLLAGATGLASGQWLSIDLLWVAEKRRGEGLGIALLRAVEDAAQARGCVGACVETASARASRFYEHAGYRLCMVREEPDPAFCRHTLQRRF